MCQSQNNTVNNSNESSNNATTSNTTENFSLNSTVASNIEGSESSTETDSPEKTDEKDNNYSTNIDADDSTQPAEQVDYNARDKYLIKGDNAKIDLSKSPYEIVETFDCDITKRDVMEDREYVDLDFNGLKINYLVETTEPKIIFILGYKITDPLYKTENNISIGSTRQEVEEIYSPFEIITDDALEYYSKNVYENKQSYEGVNAIDD